MPKIHSSQEAIKLAVEAGYEPKKHNQQLVSSSEAGFSEKYELSIAECLQDPAFWIALGKSRKWDKYTFGKYKGEAWKVAALRYFSTILESGNEEEYWENLP